MLEPQQGLVLVGDDSTVRQRLIAWQHAALTAGSDIEQHSHPELFEVAPSASSAEEQHACQISGHGAYVSDTRQGAKPRAA